MQRGRGVQTKFCKVSSLLSSMNQKGSPAQLVAPSLDPALCDNPSTPSSSRPNPPSPDPPHSDNPSPPSPSRSSAPSPNPPHCDNPSPHPQSHLQLPVNGPPNTRQEACASQLQGEKRNHDVGEELRLRKRQGREDAPTNAEPDEIPSLQPADFNAAIKFKATLGKELVLKSDVCTAITLIPAFLLHFSLNHIHRFACQPYTTAWPEACVGCDTKFSPWIVKSSEEIQAVTAVEDITQHRIKAWVQIFKYRYVVIPFLFDGHYSVFVLEGEKPKSMC